MTTRASLLLLAVASALGTACGTPRLGPLGPLGPLGSETSARPRYIGCVDSSECGSWECCVLGGGRFSIPKCMPLADVGAPCRGGEDATRPVNKTVFYPDGQTVHLPAVFQFVCPCMPGLSCTQLPGGLAGSNGDTACTEPGDHELNEV